ncbi:MAG: thioesterase [Flavobacteriales bacterium]|nr:thioesterase [Flavobacteriales bacterium]
MENIVGFLKSKFMNDHYSKLENMYLNANLNKHIFHNTKIKISNKKSVITSPTNKIFFHSLNAIHGFVYFKLLDDAAFFSSHSLSEDFFLLTLNFNISIIKPVSQGNIRAIGNVISNTKNIFHSESFAYNSQGVLVAFGKGSFVKSKVKLSEKIGYCY